MANWGSLGAYGGGVLWNQAPWLNNQDLFVVKDDYSAVFGKHFLKVGVLVSYNKKNEEVGQHLPGVGAGQRRGRVPGPERLRAGTPRAPETRSRTGCSAATVWNTGELRTNPNVQQRWKDFEAYIADTYKVNSRVTADLGVRLTHFTAPYEANDRIAQLRPQPVNPAFGNSPCNGLLYLPGKNPCAELGFAGGADGPEPVAAADQGRPRRAAPRPRLGRLRQRQDGDPRRPRPLLRPRAAQHGPRPRAPTRRSPASPPSPHARLQPGRSPASPASSFGAPTAADSSRRRAIPTTGSGTVRPARARCATRSSRWPTSATRAGTSSAVTNANEIAPQNRLAVRADRDVALRPARTASPASATATWRIWTHDRNSIYHGLQTALVSRFGRALAGARCPTPGRSAREHGPGQRRRRHHRAPTATPTARSPDLDRGRASRRQDAHLLRQPRAGPAHARGQVAASRGTSSATGRSRASSRRPPATRSPSTSAASPASPERQRRGHRLHRQPAAQPRRRPALPCQRRLARRSG